MSANAAGEKYKKMICLFNCLLLMMHIGLLGLFWYAQVELMVWANLLSVLVYLFGFHLYKKNIITYLVMAYTEVLIHMVLAVLCVGWSGGFQTYCFCLIPSIFMCDYLAQMDGRRSLHPIGISFVTILCFVFGRVFYVTRGSVYPSWEQEKALGIFVVNSMISLVFLIMYMCVYKQWIMKNQKQLEEKAEVDELTKLPNRYRMKEWLYQSFEKASEGKNTFAVAMLDIDDFKSINDRYGHDAGDLVLRKLGKHLLRCTEKGIYVCRWGGEEFLALADGEDARDRLVEELELMRDQVERECFTYQNVTISATVTVGVSEYQAEDVSFYDALNRADEQLYDGKATGKNQVRF